MSCQSARRASTRCMLTSAHVHPPPSPSHWNKCAFACEEKGTWRNRVRKLNGGRRRRRKTRQQAWGMFENVLQLWQRRRRWCKRDVHNASTVVEATLLVIREVSCGRTLQKRADWHSENILFGGKIPKHVRVPCIQRDIFSQCYTPLQFNKLFLLKETPFSSNIVWPASPLVCGPHLNPTRLAASQHHPFRVLPIPARTSIKNSSDRE